MLNFMKINRKKSLFLLVVLAFSLILSGCYAKVVVLQEAPKAEKVVETVVVEKTSKADEEASEDDVKTGLYFVTGTASSKSASGDEPGIGQADSTIIAVSLDRNNTILSCIIDSVQAKVGFDEDGNLITDVSVPVRSKNELGDEYGMRKASGIGKEWNEQMSYLASYVVGKTVEEVKEIAVDPYSDEYTDLNSSVTVYYGSFLDGIIKAAESAEYRGAGKGDTLKLSSVSKVSSSSSASVEAEGLVQADITVLMATVDEEGIITSAYIDSVQPKINFNTEGAITGGLSDSVPTKNELGRDYGMAKFSPIGKEWNEQAASYAESLVGRTVDEVLNPQSEGVDLSSSVTIYLGDFESLVGKIGQ